MARKNRASVYDGVYHVTTRIANRAMLLKPDEVKEKLMERIQAVADFSGVELWGFAIMDNHLHLIVHVPPVPKEYWLDPNDEPAAYAFGMRPPAVRPPLWSPAGACPPAAATGDCPPPSTGVCPPPPTAARDCPRLPVQTEGDPFQRALPPTGFMLDDAEMIRRLSRLYGDRRARGIASEWERLRAGGLGNVVDERKERYCRRMYNLTQCLKTLKESVSTWYNGTYGREGCLWQGRFYSGIVDRSHAVLSIVAAYVAYNPVKAHIARTAAEWKWGSYGLAATDAGPAGGRCREMYERMFGKPWEEVRGTLESVFADELPPGITEAQLKAWFDNYDETREKAGAAGEDGPCARDGIPRLRASQMIHASPKVFRTGAYISADKTFLEKVKTLLPAMFPIAGGTSIRRCRAFLWELPARLAA